MEIRQCGRALLGRKPKSMLPNSIEREVDWRSMLEERTTEQTKLPTKPGKNSSEKFRPGDKVILQKRTGSKKQWIETGVIEQARIFDDGTNHSFIINLDRGGQCLRNKRHKKQFKATTVPHRDDKAMPDPPYMNTRGRRRSN